MEGNEETPYGEVITPDGAVPVLKRFLLPEVDGREVRVCLTKDALLVQIDSVVNGPQKQSMYLTPKSYALVVSAMSTAAKAFGLDMVEPIRSMCGDDGFIKYHTAGCHDDEPPQP